MRSVNVAVGLLMCGGVLFLLWGRTRPELRTNDFVRTEATDPVDRKEVTSSFREPATSSTTLTSGGLDREAAAGTSTPIDCLLIEDVVSQVSCIRSIEGDDEFSVERYIAKRLCASEMRHDESAARLVHATLVARVNRRMSASFDAIFEHCSDMHSMRPADFVRFFLRWLWENDRDLALLLGEELRDGRAVSEFESHAGVMTLAELAILTDSKDLVEELCSIAAGAYGAGPSHMDFAALYAARALDASGRLSFVERVCASPDIHLEVDRLGMGSTLMHVATWPTPSYAVDSAHAVGVLVELLEHPLFGSSAAGTLVKGDVDRPPFLDVETWSELTAHARALGD